MGPGVAIIAVTDLDVASTAGRIVAFKILGLQLKITSLFECVFPKVGI